METTFASPRGWVLTVNLIFTELSDSAGNAHTWTSTESIDIRAFATRNLGSDHSTILQYIRSLLGSSYGEADVPAVDTTTAPAITYHEWLERLAPDTNNSIEFRAYLVRIRKWLQDNNITTIDQLSDMPLLDGHPGWRADILGGVVTMPF